MVFVLRVTGILQEKVTCYSAAILDIMQDSISDLVHIRAVSRTWKRGCSSHLLALQ